MNDELKQIKKIYGEEMMHLCRELFPSLLEREGQLLNILTSKLAPTRSFAGDIKEHNLYDEFKSWIYSFIDVEKDNQVVTNKTPFQLMDEAGYILYECKSEEDIQKFKKYYADGEELCTFRGGRLNRCHVFFAVKKNVNQIKREDFKNPHREDEYGTSVISIQFSKGKLNDLSIKNRYNHTVNNPDSTFSNNLEIIVPGLTKSFEKYYELNISQNINRESYFLNGELKYIRANNGKFYRYNEEINGIYYCEKNIIVRFGNVVTKYADNPERYILMDHFILDLKEKKVFVYDIVKDNAFVKSIDDVGKIKNIEITKNGNNRIIIFDYENNKQVKVEINKNNAIVSYENNYVKNIDTGFLCYNEMLSKINIPNVEVVGERFLNNNQCLLSIDLPKTKIIGYGFLFFNEILTDIRIPEVMKIGDAFLCKNMNLKNIDISKVEKIGAGFLSSCDFLESINAPNVKSIGDGFLISNVALTSIDLPCVEKIGDNFLRINSCLSSLALPCVKQIGKGCLAWNKIIDKEKIIQEMEARNAQVNNQRNR